MEDQLKDVKRLEHQRNELLAKLKLVEEKKDTVKPAVFEKVKRDYDDKIAAVTRELLGKKEYVEQELKTVESDRKKYSSLKEGIETELEELELRYSIGEHDDDTFKQMERELRHKLTEAEKGIKSVTERTAWMQDLLSLKGAAEPTTILGEEKAEEIIPTREEVFKEEPKLEPEAQAEPEEKHEEKPEEKSGEEVPAAEPKKEEKFKFEDFFAELKGGPKKAAEEPPAKPEPPVEEPKSDLAKDLEIEEHIFSKQDAFREQPKKIVCPKCGFDNNPDSWYCEKCGAEILQESGK